MTKPFRPFRSTYSAAVSVRSRGYLPHWEVDGGIYSVTYRLADSLPRAIALRLVEERARLIESISGDREPTAVERAEIDRLFFLRLDGYLDRCYGSCALRDPVNAGIVAENLQHMDGTTHCLLAWCVMPNHVHTVFELFLGKDLRTVLHSWKSYTSKAINEVMGRHGRLWQVEYFDRLMRDSDDQRSTIEYVLNNPAAAGLRDWPWTWVRR